MLSGAGKNSGNRQYRALIVGCGKIAGFFEEPGSELVYGHALAYWKNKNISQIAFVDIDSGKARQMAQRYAGKWFSDIQLGLDIFKPEIVSVCTPDQTHFSIVNEIILSNVKPGVVLLEKPACGSSMELDTIQQNSIENNVAVVVNHSRRFDRHYHHLKEFIDNNIYGSLIRADFTYYGGWKHNGIHLIDTVLYLFGGDLRLLKIFGSEPSRIAGDPTIELLLELKSGNIKSPVKINSFNEDNYQVFEFDFKFENGRVRIENFEKNWCFEKKIINNLGEAVLEADGNYFPHSQSTSPIEIAVETIIEYLSGNGDALHDYSLHEIRKSMEIIWSVN